MDTSFDVLIENPLLETDEIPGTIGQMLFEPLAGRDEDSRIILSHLENRYLEITLGRLRLITSGLMEAYRKNGIAKGSTVVLLTFSGCNEMITALNFLALASMGCLVFMPMYTETAEFPEWLDRTRATHIVLPEREIMNLNGHDREKSSARNARGIALAKGISVLDPREDSGLYGWLSDQESTPETYRDDHTGNLYSTDPDDELLVVTTSGTSGRSRLVTYTHAAYFYNCQSWRQAGLFRPECLGGTGFTPLFTHTMGIRAFVNALFTGSPVCLIITEWFFEKPETVRYLLLKMAPAHITGGPAVYNAFLELFRIFPELKNGLGAHFRTLVSSGAAYNHVTAKEIRDATGLPLHNAYGTTETQQVLSTLLCSPEILDDSLIPLGRPLPGVAIGLTRTEAEGQYRLYIRSAFGHKRCLTEAECDYHGYFDTGDIVLMDDRQNLYFAGRVSQDYFKDDFGVKIPLRKLREYYLKLLENIIHAEFYPVRNFPGLSALLFVNEPSAARGLVKDRIIRKKYAAIVESINDRLIHELETFEFQHRHVCRIAVVNEFPPKTGKGSISVREISLLWHDVIERLTDTRKDATYIELTEKQGQMTCKYSRYVSPLIGSMLQALRMNISYHRGKGDFLFARMNGKETKVLDLAGGYGTNLTGHNHPVIVRAAANFISSGRVAVCNQASLQETTGLLAERLNLLIGAATGRSYKVVFANSGSEAMEIALQHAYFRWRKQLEKYRDQQLQLFGNEKEVDVDAIWKANMDMAARAEIRVIALSRSFHGHSTGARNLLGNIKKRDFFNPLLKIKTLFVDDKDSLWKDELERFVMESVITLQKVVRENGQVRQAAHQQCTIIASVAEPVTGEGGVSETGRDLLRHLSAYDFPLISDEIQCGLGRTGNIPECADARYYLFGKALGGGIEKISAVLIDNAHYCKAFSEYYVSTFANGELAAHTALAALQLIETEKLHERAAAAGAYLKSKLSAIRNKYPSVIKDIQGKGMLQAVYFNPSCAEGSILLRILFKSEKAGYLFSAWFLNRHRIRILPTLSAPDALRIEPSAFFSRAMADKFCRALDELCAIINEKRAYDLFSFLMDDDPYHEGKGNNAPVFHFNPNLEKASEGAVKTAFIAHFAHTVKELRMLEPDFDKASDTGLRILFNRMQMLLEMKPVLIMASHLFDRKVHFSFYALPLDSAELEYLHKSGRRNTIVSRIQEAVDMAAANGAVVISLGGYASILTNNGLSLAEPPGTRIITGNTLTAASGLTHLRNVITGSDHFNKRNTIAVVGSTGNIGSIISQMLYEQDDICRELLLISRLEKREAELPGEIRDLTNPAVAVRSSTSLAEIRNADVIIVCTNTNDPIILPHHLACDKPVLVSDLSVPSAVAPEVRKLHNVTVLPFASYVSLPADKEAVISSFSPPGTVFCCAGEAILMALESCELPLKGRISPDAVRRIAQLAGKYGLFETVESIDSYKTIHD